MGSLCNKWETVKTSKKPYSKSKAVNKRAKKVRRVIFKGDGRLDANFSRFLERLNVFWILHMSGYLMNLITHQKHWGVQGSLYDSQKHPKRAKNIFFKGWFFKGMVVLTHFFDGYGKDSSCSGLLTYQRNLCNQLETMPTLKDPSGKFKMAN